MAQTICTIGIKTDGHLIDKESHEARGLFFQPSEQTNESQNPAGPKPEPSRSTREGTECLPDLALTLTLTFSNSPRRVEADGHPKFAIGSGPKDADIVIGSSEKLNAVSRRHLLVDFDERFHVVVRDVSKFGCGVVYKSTPKGANKPKKESEEDDIDSSGDKKDPPTWVIPTGWTVSFRLGRLPSSPRIDISVPDHQSHWDEYVHNCQVFRASNNNAISNIGILNLDSQMSTTRAVGAGAVDADVQGVRRDKLGRYAWIPDMSAATIGEGSFGSVVHAYNTTNWSMYAGKKMDRSTYTKALKFDREAAFMRSLRHPHIARYIDEETREQKWSMLIMEYCALKDLATQHKKQQLSPAEVLEVFVQATSALTYLHEQGITHRDIKPANILVRSRQPKWDIALSDFGQSKRADLMETRGQGTLMYMAPEVLGPATEEGKKVATKYSNKADIWSMGLVAIELLSSLPRPRHRLDDAYAARIASGLEGYLADAAIDPRFAQLLREMVSWDPSGRPSAQECYDRAASLLAEARPAEYDASPAPGPSTNAEAEQTQSAKRKATNGSSEETARPLPKKTAVAGVVGNNSADGAGGGYVVAREIGSNGLSISTPRSLGSLMNEEMDRELGLLTEKGPTSSVSQVSEAT